MPLLCQTLKESCDSTEDPEADGCGSDSHPVMTCSSSPSLRPHVERGAGTAARSTEQKEERGDKRTAYLYIYTDLHGRFRDLYSRTRAAAASGPSQHTHGPSPAPSRCLSCSPIVGYFLFGAVGLYGEGRVFFPTSGPNCLHSHC